MRVLAVDPGTRRVGLALSDATGTLASPHAVVERRGDRAETAAEIARIVGEAGATRVVVGLPRRLSGAEGTSAQEARADAEAIAAAAGVPVELWDERLTTVTATRGQQSRGTRARRGRATIDAEAAAVLLQSWLDGPRRREVADDG